MNINELKKVSLIWEFIFGIFLRMEDLVGSCLEAKVVWKQDCQL